MTKSQATPVLIGRDSMRSPLERVRLGSGLHNEAWLQALIHDHPEILPIAEIEPAFGELIAAAREVPCGHGFIDNLYVTPAGDIVLVETKLWRNAESRREVVAQTLDYVAALTTMGFERFEEAVTRGESAPKRLYDLVAQHPDALGEAAFIDAISQNLKRGRLLAMVLGDGIRSETEALADLLQSHAGAHFTFALVELATWRSSSGDILAVPNTLARTVMIERGVVRIENGAARIEQVPQTSRTGPQSISMADFWDKMAERDPGLPQAIRAFLEALEPLGVYPDLKASLNIKADLPDREKPVNFGYITGNGQFWPNPAAWSLPENVWRPYFETLAALVGGRVIDEPGTKFVAVSGRSALRVEQLLPEHHDELVGLLSRMIRQLTA